VSRTMNSEIQEYRIRESVTQLFHEAQIENLGPAPQGVARQTGLKFNPLFALSSFLTFSSR